MLCQEEGSCSDQHFCFILLCRDVESAGLWGSCCNNAKTFQSALGLDRVRVGGPPRGVDSG